MTTHDWQHKQWTKRHLSDSDVSAEIRRFNLRHAANFGSPTHRLINVARSVLLGLCVAATTFLIFKTLYSPAVSPTKTPPAAVSKAP